LVADPSGRTRSAQHGHHSCADRARSTSPW
jgi:hypothetical protein